MPVKDIFDTADYVGLKQDGCHSFSLSEKSADAFNFTAGI